MKYLIVFLLLVSCSANYHYQKALDKGYKVSVPILEVKTKEIIPEVVTITDKNGIKYDTIIYAEIEILEKKDTVYFPKTKIDFKIDKERMKFLEDSMRVQNNRFKDSLKLSMKQSIKKDRNTLKLKKNTILDKITRLVMWLVALIIVILVAIQFFKRI